MKDPRRWLLLLAIAAAAGALFFATGPKTKQSHAQCLTSASCLKTERCWVEPKGDGFATFGTCLDACEDDLQCAAGHRCDEALVKEAYLVPLGTKGAGPKREKVCRWGTREEGSR
jgi:hypothetical protein